MKLKMYFLLLALGTSASVLQSCNDDNDGITVPVELQNALSGKHAGAQRIEWEVKGTYYVADFHEDNLEKEAWFTADAVWQMTETDILYTALPPAVKTSFETSQYAAWHVDDVDKLERREVETVYVIEAEQGKQEIDLYYTEAGVLVKEVADGGGNTSDGYLPGQMPDAIKAFITEKYPDARIVEVDVERNMIEVDIIHNNTAKELLFTSAGEWISTSWDIRTANLPQQVVSAANTRHPGYRIDDADFVETPTAEYYLLELEQGEKEVYLKVKADGTILS